MYGTRKSRPGAKPSSAAKPIAHFVEVEDDITEMDDLPVRATVPDHLVSDGTEQPQEESRGPRRSFDRDRRGDRDERRPPRRRERDSSRGDNNYERRPRSYETAAPQAADEQPAIEATESAEAEATDETAENRPERFSQVERPARQMEEFKPSRDGRRQRGDREKDDGAVKTDFAQAPKKEGFFKKLLGFFTGGSSTEAPSKDKPRGDRPDRNRNRNRNRRPGDGEGRSRGPRGGRGRPEGQAGEGGAPNGARSDGRSRGRSRNRNRNRNRGERGERSERPAASQE